MTALRKFSTYLVAPILAVLLFAFLFKLWSVDLTTPVFGYDTDSVLCLFYIKNIIDTGWIFTNSYVGLPHINEVFNIYDFPIQSDIFNLGIFKLFAVFTDNPALIANLFFILTFAFIAFASFLALRAFDISVFSATIISVIYAFLPYHILRSVGHLFLSNYMVVPLAIMVALWIIQDKLKIFGKNAKGQYTIIWNKYFTIGVAVAIFISCNGVYHAYYSCIIFIFAWFVRGLRNGAFLCRGLAEVILICVAAVVTLIILYFPTLIYQMQHGANAMVGGRATWQSEFYALRIIDMLLPITGHHIDSFSLLRDKFNDLIGSTAERNAATLGILSSIGFVSLLLWSLAKTVTQENLFLQRTIKKFSLEKKDQELISDLSALNILTILFASVGGFVMFISMTVPLIRSHARFCIFIAFFALFFMAIIFDKIIEKKLWRRKIYTQIFLFVLMILGVYDQVGKGRTEYVAQKYAIEKYSSDHDFVAEIEKAVPPQSAIYMLPFSKFPEVDVYQQLVGYVNSKQLRWSYPAIVGRETSDWQQYVSTLDFKTSLAEIKKAGFVGIYVDRPQYVGTYSKAKLKDLEKFLRAQTKSPVIVSRNKQLLFFKI